MATKIRLKRIGRRNRPFYRLVIMDARKRRDGAAIEEVGWYNPTAKDEMYSLKEDRILHWLQKGAQPTDTAHDILRTAGLAHKWHLMKQGLDESAVEKEMKKWSLEREDVLERRRQRAEARVAEKKIAAEKKVAEAAAEADKPSEPAAKAKPTEDDVPVDVEADGSGEDSDAKDEVVQEDKVTEEETGDKSVDEEDDSTAEAPVDVEADGSGEDSDAKD
nr:30S ribosomal protein S16 [Candidatus Neomarinimicrobiota bacterium]